MHRKVDLQYVKKSEEPVMRRFNGVKVFSATLAKNREELGDKCTEWLREHQNYEVVDMRVVQSSDREFHCISLVIFYALSGTQGM